MFDLLVSGLLVAGAVATHPRPHDTFDNVRSGCGHAVVLPEPTGPHQVGTTNLFLIDGGRRDDLTEDPNDLRQIVVQLWYPGVRTRDQPPIAYVPELELMRAGLLGDEREMPQKIAAGLAEYSCVITHSFPNVAASDLADAFPLIIFSPGGNMSRHWHTAQAQEFASHGYVVAVLSHAHSGMDVFPSGGLLMSATNWDAPKGASQQEENRIENALADMLAADVRFTLDKLLERGGVLKKHPLAGRIDPKRLAIVGHSRGGKTVARACSTDPRLKACVTYDNLAPEREQRTGLAKPQLTIRGEWRPPRVDALHSFMEKNPTFAADVELKGAGHFSFSDLPIVDPKHYKADLPPVLGLERSNRITLTFLGQVHAGRKPDLSDEVAEEVVVWTNQHD